jgi:glutamate N-acetyltransferase / amino-acid N-acetyltransferase
VITGWGPSDHDGLRAIPGGVTAAPGFAAGGVVSGVKASGRPDLALVVADGPATVAVLTTTNQIKAPACSLCERHAADGNARAVVVNSGNANVCTPDGDAHAARLAAGAADLLDVAPTDVLVMSTGVIGVPLPIERIEQALPALVADVAPDGGARAAEAIRTTDTRAKQFAVEVVDGQGRRGVVGGMAKGVGMIEPTMATLLVVVTTDVAVEPDALDEMTRAATAETFNRISVDGDRSTSDTIAVLARGSAQVDPDVLARGIHWVCAELAHLVVADGEGASRVAAVRVTSAAALDEAERLARSVATSLLVRAAVHGADPNWGRILMALGNADVELSPERVRVDCAGTTVCRGGVAIPFDRDAVATAMAADEIEIVVDVGAGAHAATVLTCDLTPEYVRFNAEYTT